MNTNIILIHGKTHSGKGAFSEILAQELKEKHSTLNIIHCSLSSYIRNLVKDFYYEGDMDSPECREFMAKVYEYGSNLYPYHKSRRVWDKDIFPNLSITKNNLVIVESFREKNDIKYFEILQEQGLVNNIITLKIVRPQFKMKDYINAKHKSENDLNDFEFMYEILNDGSLNDLRNKVIEFISEAKVLFDVNEQNKKFEVGDRIKIIKVNKDLEHLNKFVDLEGIILSWYPDADKRIKYYVDFDAEGIEENCSFYEDEMELV